MSATAKARLIAAMPGLKERAKTLVELGEAAEFLFTDGPRTADEAAARNLGPEARATIARVLPVFEATDLDRPGAGRGGAGLRRCGRNETWAGCPAPARRPDGKAASPPLFDMMAALGREESIVRLKAYAA